ncbi:MAG: signal peptidase [Candidatus Dependentiae bacterium]|nr:signal peptidase [Candidatus Dependentiae bacterium]
MHKNKQCSPTLCKTIIDIVFILLIAFVVRTFVFGIYHVPTGSAEPNLLVGDRIWGNKMVYMMQKPQRGDQAMFSDPEFVYSTNSLQKMWQKYVGISLFGVLPAGPNNWVKRVIAVPGDTIEGRVEEGRAVLYLNGEHLEESYVNPYPLLRVRKNTGFVSPHSFFARIVPSILHSKTKEVMYTVDLSIPLADQPYYAITPDEVVTDKWVGTPIMEPADKAWYLFDRTHPEKHYTVDEFGPFTVPEGKLWVQGDSRHNSHDSRFVGFVDQELLLGRASVILFSLDSEEPFWFLALLQNPITFFTNIIRWNRVLKPLWGIPDLRLESKGV